MHDNFQNIDVLFLDIGKVFIYVSMQYISFCFSAI